MSEEKKQSKLHGLYIYKDKLNNRLSELTKQKEAVDTEISEVNGKLSGVNKKIHYIEQRGLLITTHAIQRYHERIDMDATEDQIRERIATPQLMKMIATLGNGVYPVDDFQVIIQDNKVITVQVEYPKERPVQKAVIKPRRIKPRKHGR